MTGFLPKIGPGQGGVFQQAVGSLVRDSMSPHQLEVINQLTPDDVLNVRGAHDHIDRVLEGLIPYRSVNREQITTKLLDRAKVAFVNCGGAIQPPVGGHLSHFALRGGLVVTTDWALRELVQTAFPGFVKYSGIKSSGHNICVELSKIDSDDPMIQHFVSQKDFRPVWFVESASELIALEEVGNRNPRFDDMRILASSLEMATRFHGSDIVALTFPWGEGRVAHFVSHLYLQKAAMTPQQRGTAGATRSLSSCRTATRHTTELMGEAERAGSTAAEVSSSVTGTALLAQLVSAHLIGKPQDSAPKLGWFKEMADTLRQSDHMRAGSAQHKLTNGLYLKLARDICIKLGITDSRQGRVIYLLLWARLESLIKKCSTELFEQIIRDDHEGRHGEIITLLLDELHVERDEGIASYLGHAHK
ncbi:MAG: hypothetical protein ACD_62C00294G0008 [uncultured bacterium]|nr:MAG: hypothetical protein ACD_62C00294G0008 [uncultured bacterium]